MLQKLREFRDSAGSPGFLGVSVSRNSDAKPLNCATSFVTGEPRHRLEKPVLAEVSFKWPLVTRLLGLPPQEAGELDRSEFPIDDDPPALEELARIVID